MRERRVVSRGAVGKVAIMSEPVRYTAVAKALHWTIALVIIVQIPAAIWMVSMDFSNTKFLMYQMHKSFGLIVLALSVFRLFWRLTHKVPSLPANTTGWKKLAAQLTHVAFYVAIIGIPLTGWLLVSASTTGIPTKIFFVIPVPHLPVASSTFQEDLWTSAHNVMAKSTIVLIVLHVAAALNHHYREKDDVLRRMLPSFMVAKKS